MATVVVGLAIHTWSFTILQDLKSLKASKKPDEALASCRTHESDWSARRARND